MNIAHELRQYGISEHVIRRFTDDHRPELVNYLDLLPNERASEEGFLPDGAVENDRRPVLYYVNASRLSSSPNDQLIKLNKSIACRGERAHLAVIKPGILEVAPVKLGEVEPEWKVFSAGTSEAINFYTNLVHANVDGQRADESDLVFDEMHKLLLTGIDRIARQIGADNVLSLVGRALFFRFLCDRDIITPADTHKICSRASELHACFDNAENAYQTSRWLDQTFNGDFLPLRERGTRQFFEGLNRSKIVFKNLSAIVRGNIPIGDDDYQGQFSWAMFDFAHVPVGLLSQVYEAFCWKWDEAESSETSVHYTPRNIAMTLVDEAFDGLENAAQAKVLDPACGAGVFLVLAFRRLYLEHWRASGIRPDTKVIRRILERQLCGFDISKSALRLSALSLYLTAIELDPQPIPPEKLKFHALDDSVLFNHRTTDRQTGSVIGSLGSHVGDKFDKRFDLVLCNPPWSRIRENEELSLQLNSVSKEIISRKDEATGKVYQNPDHVPDLPFLWKATEWCRPKGRIAMALPARTLFKQGDVSRQARSALFQLIRFTGIVNCSNVRKTNVWPDMDQPFMLVFARNEIPQSDSAFWFVSPQADTALNRVGELRIDAHAAHVLEIGDVLKEDWLLKTLAIGTRLDVDVVRKIRLASRHELGEYWSNHLTLTSRQGYTVKGSPQKDASLMKDLLDAGSSAETSSEFTIVPQRCRRFRHDTLKRSLLLKHSADPLRVYRGPLLLLRQSLPRDRHKGTSLSCYVDIAFNKSFYGYSAKGHPDARLLIQYLHLFAHSNLWFYFALCTSAKLGVERTYFYKEDFDSCPIIPLEDLTNKQRLQISALATRLESKDETVFEEIDEFFGRLYGLSNRDCQVINDTLTVRSPHDELGKRASNPPTNGQARQFRNTLQTSLNPFAKKLGKSIVVETLGDAQQDVSFRFLSVRTTDQRVESSDWLQAMILELAEKTGASIIIQANEESLRVGLLNQYRYWTRSRARLLAADILRDYFSVFEGNK